MQTNLFTYGSLMFEPVWQRVVRGRYRAEPAQVFGFRRFAVAGATYPGMVAAPGARFGGLVYFGIDAADLARLDAFEGSDYRRITIEADFADGRRLAVESYLYLKPAGISDSPWLPEAFQMQRFLQTYCPTGPDEPV